MAFPTWDSSSNNKEEILTSTHTVNYAGTPSSGDLYIAIIFFNGGSGNVATWPSGWNTLRTLTNTYGVEIAWKKSDGTETGSFEVTLNGTDKSVSTCILISGNEDPTSVPPEISADATGTSINPDSSSLTPSWGADDTLWLALVGATDTADGSTWTQPTSYSTPVGTHGASCADAAAYYANNAVTEDPGQWTMSASHYWQAFTVAIPSVGAGGSSGPILTSPAGSETGDHDASGSVSTDTANGTLYWIVDTSGTAPSVAQIQAGQGSDGVTADAYGSQSVTATGTQNVSASGLSGATIYDYYFQHQDGSSNDSTVVSSSSFTTAPERPISISASNTGVTRISWTGTKNDSGTADQYYGWYSATGAGGWIYAGSVLASASISFTVDGLPSGSTWYCSATSVDTSARESGYATPDSATTQTGKGVTHVVAVP